jgi:predicted transposase/invertase (TIGR01784 family)
MRTNNSAQGALMDEISIVPAQEQSTAYHDGRLDLSSRARRSAIQAADERLVYLSGDEDEIRAYERRFKAACDLTSMRNGAIREGHAKGEAMGMKKGRAKGRAEGQAREKLEIARKMKQAGRPFTEIAEFTGLPPETIIQM